MWAMIVLRALPALLILSACGGGEEARDATAANTQAPAPIATGPAPRTPTMKVPTLPGNEAEWMEPQPSANDPKTAPYANMLDQPVVDAPRR